MYKYFVQRLKVECIDTLTLLGFDIGSNILWETHVTKLKANISKLAYALKLKKIYT